jgi:hypothetical protein
MEAMAWPSDWCLLISTNVRMTLGEPAAGSPWCSMRLFARLFLLLPLVGFADGIGKLIRFGFV